MRYGPWLAVAAITGVVALGGCKVGPNYKAPAIAAPPAFSDNGHNGNWALAQPADQADRGTWWQVYNDPVLNDLETRCATANQNIAAALHAYEQAHEIVAENRAVLFPIAGISPGVTRQRTSGNRPRTQGAATNWDFLIPLSISWEPDLWGRIRRQVESSAASAQASAADLASTRLSLQGTLAITYLQIRGLDLQAQLLRSTLDTYTQALNLAQARYNGGLGTLSDVAQAQAQLEGTRAQLVDLGVQRQQSEHAIAVLVGAAATGFTISEKPLEGEPPSVPTGVPSELLERRPDIASAERRVAAANAQIGVQQAALYPRVTLGVGGSTESLAVGTIFNAASTAWTAGGSAAQTLYDAGERRARIRAALEQREQATSLYRQQVLLAFRDVEDQLTALRVLEEEAAVQQRAVNAAQQSADLSLIRYRGGLVTYLEVLTNQTILLNDQRIAAGLVARRIVASAQLQVSLGGGFNKAQLPAD